MRRGHIESLEIVDGVMVVAAADPAPESLMATKAACGGIRLYEDYRQMLQTETLDAVVVATPNDTHADIVCDVLGAGIHVLGEKPVANSLEGCNRIADAVLRSDRVFQVGLECRYAAIHQRMRALIKEGRMGRVRQLWCKSFRGPWELKVDQWITKQSRSGGTLVEKHCHHFDLFNWFTDENPVQVSGYGTCDLVYGADRFGVEPDVLDNVQVVVQYESGAVATQMSCMYCTGLNELEVGVIGTEGWLVSNTGSRDVLRIFQREVGEQELELFEVPDDIRRRSHSGAVYLEHLAFADSIRNGTVPMVGAEAGWWSTVLGLAAEQAVREGRIVSLSEFSR